MTPSSPTKCIACIVAIGIVFYSSLATADDATAGSSNKTLCAANSQEPCWNYLALGVTRLDQGGTTSSGPYFSYSHSLSGPDTSGVNSAWLMDYAHIRATPTNSDSYDVGLAFYWAPGGKDQISQQIGFEALLSGVRTNPDVGAGSLENGHTLAFVYRVALPVSGYPPIEVQLRFLHESLTSQTPNGLEGQIVAPIPAWGANWPARLFLTYRHDNTQFKMIVAGVRFDFTP